MQGICPISSQTRPILLQARLGLFQWLLLLCYLLATTWNAWMPSFQKYMFHSSLVNGQNTHVCVDRALLNYIKKSRCSTFSFVTEKEIKRSWLCNNVYILMLMFLCLCSYLYYYYQSFSFALSFTAGWNEWPKCLHQNTGCSHTQITRLMPACVCVLSPFKTLGEKNGLFTFLPFFIPLSYFFLFKKHGHLYKSNSVDYQGRTVSSDIVPPTPAFPVSPPTPYGKR